MRFSFVSDDGAIVAIGFSCAAWIIGHQSSHCVAIKSGNAPPIPVVQNIMGFETLFGSIFLAWFAYQISILDAIILYAISFPGRIIFVQSEKGLGLSKREWLISLTGIILVPAILLALAIFIRQYSS